MASGKARQWTGDGIQQCFLTRYTTVFVENDEVSYVIRSACFRQFLHDIISTIYAMRIGEDQSHLLFLFISAVPKCFRGSSTHLRKLQ